MDLRQNLVKPCIAKATQATIRAGYSEKTAQEQGSRLLLNVMVSEAIQEAMDKHSDRLEPYKT